MKKITKSQLKAIKLQINDADSGNIFLEGFRMLDSIKEIQDISYGVITSDAINDSEKNLLIKNLLNKADLYLLSSDELKYLSRLRNPEGLLLAIKKPEFSLDRFFKEGSFRVYSAEKTKDSIPIHKLHTSRRMIIVFGNEGHGISRELSSLSEKSFLFPLVRSLIPLILQAQ